MNSLKKDISFDGINFHVDGVNLGRINNEFQGKHPIPKAIMDAHKEKLIEGVIG